MNLKALHISKFTTAYRYLLFALCLTVLVWSLKDTNIQELSSMLSQFSFDRHLLLFSSILILAFFNWTVELFKWKVLLRRVNTYPIKTVILSLLNGVSAAFVTPGRTGDVFARAINLRKEDRGKAVTAMILSSGIQLSVTLLLGVISVFLLRNALVGLSFSAVQYSTILMIVFGIVALGLGLFLLITKQRVFKKIKTAVRFARTYSRSELGTVIFLSTFRYSIFVFQFYLALVMFGIDLSLIQGMGLISVIYLLTFILPSSFLGELGIRETFAVFVLSPFSESVYPIIFGSLLIWCINLALPALLASATLSLAKSST